MKTIELNGDGKIREGRTEIDVPHLGKTLTFVLPLIGKGSHQNVMEQIGQQSLSRSTTAQTLSLLDLAFQNRENGYCAGILSRFTNQYLWTATESLSFPEGVLIYDNVDGKMPQTSSELMKLVEQRDPRVRLVSEGFETGRMTLPKFLEHPYTIAQVGEKMMPVLERVAKQVNKSEARVYGLNNSDSDSKRCTAVDGCNGRLILIGDCDGNGRGGFASGVLKTGGASRAKKSE